MPEPGARPRLLFLCQTLPYPPDGGVKIRSYHTLRLLAERLDVEAICFVRRATSQDLEAELAALRALAPTRAIPIPQETSRFRLLADHARSIATGKAYTEYVHASPAFGAALDEALRRFRPDHVHVDSLDLSWALNRLDPARVVLTHHNVESQLLHRRAERERGLRGRYLRHQAGLMERMERHWARRVRMNVVVSEPDARMLTRLAPGSRVTVIPNGVDTEAFRPATRGPTGLVFVGGTTWFPNRDALDHFATAILPLIRKTHPDLPVTWVGRATETERAHYASEHGITLTGHVPSIVPHVHGAAVYVCPLRVGGGTRLKLLDAWALGMPIVSTSAGAEGLAVEDGVNMVLADTPEAFSSAVLSLLADRARADAIGASGRATAERTYSWARIGESLTRLYGNQQGASVSVGTES